MSKLPRVIHHLVASIICLPAFVSAEEDGFQFRDGDMVVLVGNTFIEREQESGYIETALTLAAGDAKVRFRNLGWSGDTVYGDARSYFGPPEEGFERLSQMMTELQPDVVILCYGAVAAFEGQEGLKHFTDGYERLLTMIYEKAGPRETVLLTPPPAESLGDPLPDMTEHNERLALYSKAITDLANRRELRAADLFSQLKDAELETFNGVHFTPEGYEKIAPAFLATLGLEPVTVSGKQEKLESELRSAIIEKNRLYFHRWRPANETYLRLFRAHEQGQNAKELPMFDPLVADQEDRIQSLKGRILKK